jgi:cystathionine beta-synthase
MGHDMDAIVFGVGSSGTVTGLSRFFARVAPHVDLVLADPQGSILTGLVNDGKAPDTVGSWTVEGIGSGFVPSIADLSRVRRAYQVSDKDSFLAGRELLMKEGILGGSSSGTILAAALRYCRDQSTPKKVVAFVCDTGNKYLSKMYNDYWMLDNGYIEREQHGDLRDLILRPYSQRDTVVVKPDDLLLVAYQRMKLYDVSQLPVMDGERLVGILDESDVLMHVFGNESRFRDPVSTAMMAKLDLIDVKRPLAELIPLFDRGHVAIVMDGERFLGLITRIDLLNYLRRRVS